MDLRIVLEVIHPATMQAAYGDSDPFIGALNALCLGDRVHPSERDQSGRAGTEKITTIQLFVIWHKPSFLLSCVLFIGFGNASLLVVALMNDDAIAERQCLAYMDGPAAVLVLIAGEFADAERV